MKVKEISGMLKADGLKFGIVISRFNDLFTGQLLRGALDCLERHGARDEAVTVAWVPGSFEIPLAVQQMAAAKKFDAIVALGKPAIIYTCEANMMNKVVGKNMKPEQFETALKNGVIRKFDDLKSLADFYKLDYATLEKENEKFKLQRKQIEFLKKSEKGLQ